MSKILAGVAVIFVGVALFHLASHDAIGNMKTAWGKLKGSK